jgi:ketopantoate reductase
VHVCIVGAGALGTVYGARLARLAGCDVSVVARSPAPPSRERLEKVDDGDVIEWNVPARVTEPPREADVIMAFVRYEQLGELPARARAPTRADVASTPIVVMTPMMPQDHAALAAALPGRVLTGMPSVVSYRNAAGAIRYWLPQAATTYVEARPSPGAEAELVKRLARADVHAELAPGVLERNVATTVSFIPLAMGLDAAGSLDALLRDQTLLALAVDAAAEGRALGKTIGRAEPWASTLLRFVGPRILRLGLGIARARAPEAIAYAEQHFGRKLHAQNIAMAEKMIELARQTNMPQTKMLALLERMRSTG